ncbi:MAG TPA: hypothetical protein VJR67_01145 [Candidatus Nitrosopolaris sp.]|nr:hypothetical protein [Candidatus Nitrosopolaris sp.]
MGSQLQLLALLSFSIIFLSTSYEPPAHAQLTKFSALIVPLTTSPNAPSIERERQHNSTYAPFLLASPSSYSKNPLSVMSTPSGVDRNLSSSQPPPIANAGSSQTVTAGSIVTLNGSKSKSPNGIILAYSWMQVPTGSSTSLGGVNTPVWQFVAPKVTSNTLIRFQLNVTDNVGQNSTAFVNILDKPFTKFTTLPLAQSIKPRIAIATVQPSNQHMNSSSSGTAANDISIHPPLIPG